MNLNVIWMFICFCLAFSHCKSFQNQQDVLERDDCKDERDETYCWYEKYYEEACTYYPQHMKQVCAKTCGFCGVMAKRNGSYEEKRWLPERKEEVERNMQIKQDCDLKIQAVELNKTFSFLNNSLFFHPKVVGLSRCYGNCSIQEKCNAATKEKVKIRVNVVNLDGMVNGLYLEMSNHTSCFCKSSI